MDELLIRAALRDELSAPVRQVRQEINALGQAVRRLDGESRRAADGTDRLARAKRRLGSEVTKLHAGIGRLSSSLTTNLASGLRTAGVLLAGVTAGVTFFGGKAAASYQTANIAFGALLGNVEQGNQLFAQLRELNRQTPFELQDITGPTMLLLRYGTATEKVVPLLRSLIDAASGTLEPAENLQRLSLALGQVQSQGRLLGQDARQLAESGINAYAILADRYGKTVEQVRKMGELGQLPAADLIDSIIRQQGGGLERTAGLAGQLNKTLTGQISNFVDTMRDRLANASGPLVEAATRALGPLGDTLGGMIERLGPPFFTLIGRLAEFLGRALPILEPIAGALIDAADAVFDALEPALARLAPHIPALTAGFGELVAGIVPLIPELVDLAIALVPLAVDTMRMIGVMGPAGVRIVVGFLEAITDLLDVVRPLRTVVATLLTGLLAYRLVAGVVGPLVSLATALWGVAAAQAAVGATGGAGAAAGAGGLLGKVGGAGGAAGLASRGGVWGLIAALGIADVYLGSKLYTGFRDSPTARANAGKLITGALNPFDDGPDRDLQARIRSETRPAAAAPPGANAAGMSGGLSVNGPLVHADRLESGVDVYNASRAALLDLERDRSERS